MSLPRPAGVEQSAHLARLPRPQRISYAKGTSYATIAQTEGPEAVYAIKLGLRDANEEARNKSRLTVSGAQKKLIDDRRKEKRGREDEEEEEEEEEDEDEGPQAKKSKQADEEDGALVCPVLAARLRC